MAGWFPLFSPQIVGPFVGNPNVTITAINTSGGITTSRDSDGSTYQTPFFIQASASAITATGTSAPYEDLSYKWAVTGPGSGDSFTRPTDGVTVNSFTDQTGPEAAFVFRTAGTYTITLFISGKNGSGYTSTSVSKQVVVNAFATGANEFYFDSAAAGGGDGSIGTPFNAITDINSHLTSGKWLHLKKGSHWTGGTGINFNNSAVAITGVRIDSYGSGAAPIIDITSNGGLPAFNINNGGSTTGISCKDIVVSNLDFRNSGAPSGAVVIGCTANSTDPTATIKNIYVDNCVSNFTYDLNYSTSLQASFTGTISSGTTLTVSGIGANLIALGQDLTGAGIPQGISIVSQQTGSLGSNGTYTISASVSSVGPEAMLASYVGVATANIAGNNDLDLSFNLGFWNSSFTNPTNTFTISIAMLGSAKNWNFVVGGTFSGAGTSNTFDHQIYPDTQNHYLGKWINFGVTGTGKYQRSFCLNGNWDGPRGIAANSLAQYHTYSENLFKYASFGYDFGNATNNTGVPDDTVQFTSAVVEGNAFDGTGGSLFGCGQSVTVRYNRAWGAARGDWYSPVGTGQVSSVAQNTHLLSKLYFNKIYSPSTADTSQVLFYPSSGWTAKQVITDNILVDDRTTPATYSIQSADWNTAGSLVDRNLYYFKGSSSSATSFVNNGSGINFTNWKNLTFAPDVNGSVVSSNTMGWTFPVTQWSHMG